MTNKGLCLDLILFLPGEDSEDYFEAGDLLAVLNCSRNNDTDFLALFLENIHSEQYRRSKPELLPVWGRGMGFQVGRKIVYVQQPNESYQAFRKESCTLLLGIKFLGNADQKAHIYFDELSDFKDGQRELRKRFDLEGGQEIMSQYTLRARHEGRIYFAFRLASCFILLNLSERPFGANIATRTHRFGHVDHHGYQFKEIQSLDLQHCTFDRLSRISASGRSISLKFGMGTITGSAGADTQHFIVHVTVDPDGRLPWPDPNEIQPKVE